MSVARDWLNTLWAASYKGTPFFVEQDAEEGGRRIVVHQFPMRDTPYLEDLGEDKRDYNVTAYLASDSADTDAGTLVATCAMTGPGTLVLPTHGPIVVRCLNFKRQRSKDKHGYIAFELHFIREGATSALASVANLANLIFVAADSAATAIANSFVANTAIAQQANFVVAAAVNGVQNAVSTIEAIRTTSPVDPATSATQRDALQSTFDQTTALIEDPVNIATLPTSLIASTRAVADGMPAANAVPAFEAVVTDPTLNVTIADNYPTPSRQAAAVNDAAAKQLLLLAALTAYCEAIAQLKLTDRQSAITLRANVAEYIEAILENLPADDIDLFNAIEDLRNSTVQYLSTAIINLAPVVTVEANISLPSLYWAWRLYADPNRSTELVARNQVPHPSFMPPSFEALAK
jgi:prophage DNA circulation protein